MSAATTIAFIGVRFEIRTDEEIDSLERRSHPEIIRARKAGLDHYWGNFAAPGERNLLFVG